MDGTASSHPAFKALFLSPDAVTATTGICPSCLSDLKRVAVSYPVHAYIENSVLNLHGRVTAVDGTQQIDITNKAGLIRESNIVDSAYRLGASTAQQAIEQGAGDILAMSQV